MTDDIDKLAAAIRGWDTEADHDPPGPDDKDWLAERDRLKAQVEKLAGVVKTAYLNWRFCQAAADLKRIVGGERVRGGMMADNLVAIEVFCDCGRALEVIGYGASLMRANVKPCQDCLDKARDEGYGQAKGEAPDDR